MKKRLLWLAMALFVSTGLMAQSWYLAGSSTSGDSGWLDGKNWDASGTAMTDNSDGTFSYSTTVQAGTYEFKVTNGTWDTSYGYNNVNSIASTSGYENNGGNVRFNIAAEADITIVFNPSATSITLTSSIPFGQVVITVWTVVGDEVLCGTNWDVSDTGNDMVEGESGIWTKTYENFEVTADNAGAEISFKAVANHNYSIGEYPQGEGVDVTLTLPSEAGTYNIIITLDTNTWSIDNTIEKVGGEEPEPVPAAWYIAGNGDVDAAWVGGLSWDVAGVALDDNGDGTYGYETTVPAGTYQFKITNGKWYDPENTPDGINYGYTNVDAVASASGYVDGGGNNVMFTIASEATITITLNPAAMDDAKIILASTVGFGEAVVDRWTLAGDVPFFAGSAWGFDAGNDLVETAPGVWTKVYENVEVTSDMAGQSYQYKVGANGGFDVDQYPAQGNNTFTMPAEAGSYNITFTFNAEGERTLDFECVMNEPTSIDEAAAAVITAADGRIYCDKDFIIVNLAGQDVTAANGDLQGTYLVVAGDEVVKVMVD